MLFAVSSWKSAGAVPLLLERLEEAGARRAEAHDGTRVGMGRRDQVARSVPLSSPPSSTMGRVCGNAASALSVASTLVASNRYSIRRRARCRKARCDARAG